MTALRMRMRHWTVALAVVLGVIAASLTAVLAKDSTGARPAQHVIRVTASRYAFDPPVIRVQRGDTLRLRFASTDVVHGFYLEGYDLDVTIPPLARQVELKRRGTTETVDEVVFVAGRSGKFRFRCSATCGAMHPFMMGELVVGPNRLFQVATLAAAALVLGSLAGVWWRAAPEEGR